MKVICVSLSLMLCTSLMSNAEFKNGYSKTIDEVIEQLQFMHALKNGSMHQLNGDEEWGRLDYGQKAIVYSKIKSLNSILKYYLLTERLVSEFKTICPDLFEEINSIKNYEGQITDVYIKVLPPNHEIRDILGATIISRDLDNRHVCVSEYGKNTISVQVCATKIIMEVLAHELGHVKFIVPNLYQYIEYCKIRYNQEFSDCLMFNHQASDMGSKTVFEYEKRFRQANKSYLENLDHEALVPRKLMKEINILIKENKFSIGENWLTKK